MNFLLIGLLGFFAVGGSVSSLSEDDDEAQRKPHSDTCESLHVAPHVNITWIRNTEMWFIPLVSRNALRLIAKAILSESELGKMSEEDLLRDICFHMNWKTGDQFAYGRKFKQNWGFHFNSIRRGAIDWEFKGKYLGSSYVIHTDNASFAVVVDVFRNGSRVGYVMTPNGDFDEVSNEAISEWTKKLVKVGFRKENILEAPVTCAKKFWGIRKAKILEIDEQKKSSTDSAAKKV